MNDIWSIFIGLFLANVIFDGLRELLRYLRQKKIAERKAAIREAAEKTEMPDVDIEEWRKKANSVWGAANEALKESEKDLPPSNPFASFTAFGGADLTVYLNSTPVGEVQEVEFHENFETGEVMGSFVVAVFRDKDLGAHKYRNITRIDLKYANDYGFSAHQVIGDVQVTGRSQAVGIDDIVIGYRYSFKAGRITEVEE